MGLISSCTTTQVQCNFFNFLNYIFFPLKVTGGNRGIGQAIVKRLSQEFNGIVLFTGNSKK